jgi:2-iminobutanoate/2-iminopropanoate deaminase
MPEHPAGRQSIDASEQTKRQIITGGGMHAEKQIIFSEKAPKAIGPYSQAIRAGHILYTSGQLGMVPSSGNLVEGGVEAETRQALVNLTAILESAGTDLGSVLKTTVFLRDINDFSRMNSIYAEFFKEVPPARSAVQVAALPKGAAVEIEAVALIRHSSE